MITRMTCNTVDILVDVLETWLSSSSLLQTLSFFNSLGQISLNSER